MSERSPLVRATAVVVSVAAVAAATGIVLIIFGAAARAAVECVLYGWRMFGG